MADKNCFQFRRFSLSQEGCAMSIGTDGVLLGAWAEVSQDCINPNILDVGCGCGLIGIMLAQRYRKARVFGIDIDSDAAKRACFNAEASPYADRLEFLQADIFNLPKRISEIRYDLVVSNPPYFSTGHSASNEKRAQARHQDKGFAIVNLMQLAFECLLAPKGRLALITPMDQLEKLRMKAVSIGVELNRITPVFTKTGKEPKRCLSEWRRVDISLLPARPLPLIIMKEDGSFSNSYKELTDQFYLPSLFE